MLEGLIQDYQLNLPAILGRAETLYGYREIVTRKPDRSFHRYNYADFVSRSKKLAVTLKKLGVERAATGSAPSPRTPTSTSKLTSASPVREGFCTSSTRGCIRTT